MPTNLKLKGYRKMYDVSQEEMAKALNISRRTYVNREQDGNLTIDQAKAFYLKLKEKNPNLTYEEIFLT